MKKYRVLEIVKTVVEGIIFLGCLAMGIAFFYIMSWVH